MSQPPRHHVDTVIVDDLPEFTRILSRALLRKGMSVGVSPSALHALRVLEARPHLVVVSDLSMPGPDGAEFLAAVERRWPRSRRILLSAYVDSEVVLRTHAHRIIDKSAPLDVIVQIVSEELALARA